MKKLFSKELLIGLSVLITLLILFFGINYLKGINLFKASNYYYVSYTNVAGLAQSAPVTVNGYKVGLVRDIQYEYDNPGHVLVELSLDKDLKVPAGTEAILVTDMLGTATIELHMSTSSAYHEIGDKLIGKNAPGLLDGVKDEMLPAITEVVPKVDSLLVSANTLLSDPALANSIRHLDNVMANLEVATQQLQETMKALPSIVSSCSSTLHNADELTANLNQIAKDLSVVSSQLRELPIDSTYQQIDNITRNLNDLTAQLNSPDSSLGLLLRDPGLYNNLNNSAAHVDSILIDLKRQPKKYIPSIKIF